MKERGKQTKENIPHFFQITFKNEVGQYDLEVTTFQLAVLFAWNQRPRERISFENLKLATELPDAELRRTLWVKETREEGRRSL